jgi:hypothetical protein
VTFANTGPGQFNTYGEYQFVNEVSEGEFQRLYGRWEPLVPREVASLFEGAPFRWWIAGGWAAEASGAPRRPHADTDVVVLYEDLAAVRSWLSDFHLWEAHAGSLRPLLAGDELKAGRQGLWVRRDAESPWVCDLLLTRSQDGRWLFKRAPQLSLPLSEIGQTIDGVPYLRASVVLLHKAKALRDRDQEDFEVMLPRLTDDERAWLADALAVAHPDHPWRARL